MMHQPHTVSAFKDATRHIRLRDDGQTVLEMALSLPILCLALFGFINFALVMYEIANISFASHAAARYASVHSVQTISPATNATVASFVNPFIPSYPANTPTVTVTYPATGTNAVGGTVKVVVSLTYTIRLPFYTLNSLKVSSTALAAITV